MFGIHEFGLVQLGAKTKVGGIELGDRRHHTGTGARRLVWHISRERIDDVYFFVPPASDGRFTLPPVDEVLVALFHRLDQA